VSTKPSAQPSRYDRWLFLILLLALVLRTYHLADPAWDYHNWSQSATLMVARDLARYGFALHPQVAWIATSPSAPSYFNMGFSIEGILAAMLYRIFGESDTLARLVVIAFSLWGIYSLYALLARRAGLIAARSGAFIYALFPDHLFFGRVFMPDIPAISLALAGLNALDRWTDDRRLARLLTAAGLTALALLQKISVAFVAFPILYLFWSAYGKQLLKKRELYFFGAIAAVPPAAWYAQGIAAAPHSAVSVLTPAWLRLATHSELWSNAALQRRVLAALPNEVFSPVGLALVLLGTFWPLRNHAASIFRRWLAGAAVTLVLIPGILPDNLYYFSLLLPGGAAVAGLMLAALAHHPQARRAIPAVLVLFAAGALYSTAHMFLPDRAPIHLGRLLQNLTEPNALLVTESGGSPNVLYQADRRGWMLDRNYDVPYLENLQHAGARYYADAFIADAVEHRDFFHQLDGKFQRLTTEDAPSQIYDLAPSLGPVSTLPANEIQTTRAVNFGDRIVWRGVSLRPLADFPASYEAVYYWQCLATPAADLRVFVHLTDSADKIVYQQDHWPQAGWLPTTKWRPGDIVRERYLLTPPATLPEGNYRLWLGWFDPSAPNAPRLPILHARPPNSDDRALAAEIQIPRRPGNGWFTSE